MKQSKDRLSRRQFMKRVAVLSTATGVATVAPACGPTETQAPAEMVDQTPTALQYPAVPYPPVTPPAPGQLHVFTMHEARTVEALTARLLPGTPEDPGAREAGVVFYIDNFLAYQEGFPEPTYRQPPYVEVMPAPGGQGNSGEGGTEGDQGNQPAPTPPAGAEGQQPQEPLETGPYQVIVVPAGQIERYGYQSVLTPREVYRIGVDAVDRYANQRFGANFVELTEEQQDQVVGDMAGNRATGFRQITPEQFFHVLRRHTAEGMFSDPAYGGNRDMAGWKLIGYPGAQRAYTPTDIQTEGTALAPQSLAQLHSFNPGQNTRPGVVLPLSGSDPHTWENAHQHPPQ